MSVIFLSDVHLCDTQPDITRRFTQFLSHIKPYVRAIYILGDLFEQWIGDDALPYCATYVADQLRHLTSTIPVYYMHGNRDFLLNQNYARYCGMQIIPDPSRLNIEKKIIVVSHGDAFCTLDKNYMRFRRITRSRGLQRAFLALPQSVRHLIARRLRQNSHHHQQQVKSQHLDVCQADVQHCMVRYQGEVLIHGHTHRPQQHSIDAKRSRIVLGAWENDAEVLFWPSDGKPRLLQAESLVEQLSHQT